MVYENFIVRFEPEVAGKFGTLAQSASGAKARGSFEIPVERDDLGRVLHELGAEVHRSCAVKAASSRDLNPVSPSPPARAVPRKFGRQLFDALFSGQIRSLFDQSLGRVENLSGRGLRIELHFDPEHPELVRLTSLPWELLFWHERREFLSLSRFSPVVRYLDVMRPARKLDLGSKLRILVAVSPTRDRPLDLPRERRVIERTWGSSLRIEPVFLDPVTLPGLREALSRDAFHVLHFMGHGEFCQKTGEGSLIFNDGSGDENPVTGLWLASLLRDETDLQVVFLNTCHSARSTTRDRLDPFTGVGTALVNAGVPAVVAMQFPISDRAAVEFSSAFYERLTSSQSLADAMVGGRKAILSDDNDSLEWATPVLFRRSLLEEIKKGPQRRPMIQWSRSVARYLVVVTGLAFLVDFSLRDSVNPTYPSEPDSANEIGNGLPGHIDTSCADLVFDLDRGTLADLRPDAERVTIVNSIPCRGEVVSAETFGFGSVEFPDYGFRFAIDRHFIEVDGDFRGRFLLKGRREQLLGKDAEDLDRLFNQDPGGDNKNLLYDRVDGCIQLILSEGKVDRVVLYSGNCREAILF